VEASAHHEYQRRLLSLFVPDRRSRFGAKQRELRRYPMMRIVVIHILLLATGSAWRSPADEYSKKEEALICIRLLDSGVISGTVLGRAEGVTASILASAGVRIRWDDRRAERAAVVTINVRFVVAVDERSRFATSLPFAQSGMRIIIFVESVERAGQHNPPFMSHILGHVLAHEIGHVLMRTDQHTQEGLMKARWTADDYAIIRASRMRFTTENVAAIRLGMARVTNKVDPRTR
jgi:hypothetical protein